MIVCDIADIIWLVKKLTGLRLIFRYNNNKFKLKAEYCLHTGPLCKPLRKDMQSKCNIDCVDRTNKSVMKHKKPFFKTCHAGVTELVVPVFSSFGYEGSLFLGPMKPAGKSPVYPQYKKEYARLPVYNVKTCRTIEKLLGVFSHQLALEYNLLKPEDPGRDGKIANAIAMIGGQTAKKLKAGDVAKECGLSLWYFLHLFKRKTGMSFTEYVKRQRLERAKDLLSSTNKKTKEILEACGYANENIFYMAFKKYTGLTPGEYKKQSRTKWNI